MYTSKSHFLLFIFLSYAYAQFKYDVHPSWVVIAKSGTQSVSRVVVFDRDSNTLFMGGSISYSAGTASIIDADAQLINSPYSASLHSDSLFISMQSTGVANWWHPMRAVFPDHLLHLALQPTRRRILVSGYWSAYTMDFPTVPDISNIRQLSTSVAANYIAQLTLAGEFSWGVVVPFTSGKCKLLPDFYEDVFIMGDIEQNIEKMSYQNGAVAANITHVNIGSWNYDVLLVKLSASGSYLWHVVIAGEFLTNEIGGQHAIFNKTSILVLGQTASSTLKIRNAYDNITIYRFPRSNGTNFLFLTLFDESGFLRFRSLIFGGGTYTSVDAVLEGDSDTLYILGQSSRSQSFITCENNEVATLIPSFSESQVAWLSKLSFLSCSPIWSVFFRSDLIVDGTRIRYTAKTIYVAGKFTGTHMNLTDTNGKITSLNRSTLANPSKSSSFLARFNRNGTLLWALNIDGNNSAVSINDFEVSEAQQKIFVTGTYQGRMELKDSSGVIRLNNAFLPVDTDTAFTIGMYEIPLQAESEPENPTGPGFTYSLATPTSASVSSYESSSSLRLEASTETDPTDTIMNETNTPDSSAKKPNNTSWSLFGLSGLTLYLSLSGAGLFVAISIFVGGVIAVRRRNRKKFDTLSTTTATATTTTSPRRTSSIAPPTLVNTYSVGFGDQYRNFE